jgi:hypothetical protein
MAEFNLLTDPDRHRSSTVNEQMRKVFADIDKDGSGVLDAHELREAIVRLAPDEPPPNDTELALIVRRIDTDGSGTIDFEEFKAVADMFAPGAAGNHETKFDYPALSLGVHLPLVVVSIRSAMHPVRDEAREKAGAVASDEGADVGLSDLFLDDRKDEEMLRLVIRDLGVVAWKSKSDEVPHAVRAGGKGAENLGGKSRKSSRGSKGGGVGKGIDLNDVGTADVVSAEIHMGGLDIYDCTVCAIARDVSAANANGAEREGKVRREDRNNHGIQTILGVDVAPDLWPVCPPFARLVSSDTLQAGQQLAEAVAFALPEGAAAAPGGPSSWPFPWGLAVNTAKMTPQVSQYLDLAGRANRGALSGLFSGCCGGRDKSEDASPKGEESGGRGGGKTSTSFAQRMLEQKEQKQPSGGGSNGALVKVRFDMITRKPPATTAAAALDKAASTPPTSSSSSSSSDASVDAYSFIRVKCDVTRKMEVVLSESAAMYGLNFVLAAVASGTTATARAHTQTPAQKKKAAEEKKKKAEAAKVAASQGASSGGATNVDKKVSSLMHISAHIQCPQIVIAPDTEGAIVQRVAILDMGAISVVTNNGETATATAELPFFEARLPPAVGALSDMTYAVKNTCFTHARDNTPRQKLTMKLSGLCFRLSDRVGIPSRVEAVGVR